MKYVHFAPPCGTASRSREIRRKNQDGTPADLDPQPLRSDDHPDGLPGLEGVAKGKVEAANVLYKFVASAVLVLERMGIVWTIENPTNSLMWLTSWFLHLPFQRHSMQMCMHGGKRNKHTDIMQGTRLNFGQMALACDGKHEHLPWGILRGSQAHFATACERNYPELFCRRLGIRPPNKIKAGDSWWETFESNCCELGKVGKPKVEPIDVLHLFFVCSCARESPTSKCSEMYNGF